MNLFRTDTFFGILIGSLAFQLSAQVTWTDYAGGAYTDDGIAIPPGSVVDAYDPDGVLCGTVAVGTEDEPPVPGLYGWLHVYGDDPYTADLDEGAQGGDTIRFYIDGILATPSVIHPWTGDQSYFDDVDLIIPNQPPNIDSLAPVIANETDNLAFQVTASDPYDDNLTITALNLPPGAVFSDLSGGLGTFTWQTTYEDSGTYTVSFIVTDTGGLTDTAEVNITVNNINRIPIITTMTLYNAIEDVAYVDTVVAADEDGDALNFTAVNVPSWMNVGTDGALSGTPVNDDVGTGFSVVVGVFDGNGGSDTLITTIDVININDPPIFVSALPDTGFFEDTGLWIPLSSWYVFVEDVDQATTELSWSFFQEDSVFATIVDSLIAFSAPQNWFGQDTLSIVVSDGEYSDTTALVITVYPVNDPPYFTDLMPDSVFIKVNESDTLSLTGLAADVDNPDSTLTWSCAYSGFVQCIIDTALNIAVFRVLEDSVLIDEVVLGVSDGQLTVYDTIIVSVSAAVSVDFLLSSVPDDYALYQNFPNPWNPVTTIRYTLPEQTHVNIIIYDLLGREIKTLVNKIAEPGYKTVVWNATDNSGEPVCAGVYIYKIQAGTYTRARKMILLK